MFQVVYSKRADRDLENLDKPIRQRILIKIDFFVKQNDPLQFAEPLKDFDLGKYRFRIGDYRIVFDINKKGELHVLMILRIKHRKDVYNL